MITDDLVRNTDIVVASVVRLWCRGHASRACHQRGLGVKLEVADHHHQQRLDHIMASENTEHAGGFAAEVDGAVMVFDLVIGLT